MKLWKIKRGDFKPSLIWEKAARVGAATRMDDDPQDPQCIPLGGPNSDMWLELDREEIRAVAKLDRVLDAMDEWRKEHVTQPRK